MRKTWIAWVLSLCLLAGLLPGFAVKTQAATVSWDGWTPIRTEADLLAIDDTDEGMKGKYYLVNDITLTGTNWVPIGTEQSGGFCGIFDGNGHTISNVRMSGECAKGSIGLFNYVSNRYTYPNWYVGEVRNLNVTVEFDISIPYLGYSAEVGAITGHNWGGKIRNCTASGTIRISSSGGMEHIGGIAGRNTNGEYVGEILGCTSNVDIHYTAENPWLDVHIGGITGMSHTKIGYCGNTGDLYAYESSINMGGIMGSGVPQITDCYNSGNLQGVTELEGEYGETYLGGIVGNAGTVSNDAFINRSFNTGAISAESCYWNYVGGIAGDYGGKTMNQCYNTGEVKAVSRNLTADVVDPYVGGLCGWAQNNSFSDCYNVGSLKTTSYNSNTSYRHNMVYIGGLVGYGGKLSFTRCFNKGYANKGPTYYYWIGGIVGADSGRASTYTNTYWPYYGYMEGVDQKPSGGTANTTGQLSTSKFASQSSFAGFDFTNVWIMGDATPELRIEVPHVHSYETLTTRPATCTQKGLADGWYCSGCRQYFAAKDTRVIDPEERWIPMLEHTPGQPVKENETAGDCKSRASWETVVYCSVCKTHEISRVTEYGDFGDHTPGEPAKENEVPGADCQTPGGYDWVSRCTECGEVCSTETKIGEVGDHIPGNPEKENEIAGDCKTRASWETVVYCSVCKTHEISRVTEYGDFGGHTPVTEPAVEAQCGREGLTEGSHCRICQAVLVAQQPTPAREHSWGDWQVVTEASETASGEKVRICDACGGEEREEIPSIPGQEETMPSDPFEDVFPEDYFYDPVRWALEEGITTGMSSTMFVPDGICTRAQVVTFLWRASGSPAPKQEKNPFVDVAALQWYTDAVLWAIEQGITVGTSATTFSPDAPCTRAHVATFLWRAFGEPESDGGDIFSDVDPDVYYYDAVLWAVKEGITYGMGEGIFAPDAPCTRGQIVTFLYRAMT